MIQVSILLQPHKTVVANFVAGKFVLFRRNPWQPLAEPWGSAEPRLKNTGIPRQQTLEFENGGKTQSESTNVCFHFLWGVCFTFTKTIICQYRL